ncbi:MAG: hypothetical protein FWB90_00950 [Fibromonadales bacterium]|nr:hypothetical protein [Fibromonadales bacterium]
MKYALVASLLFVLIFAMIVPMKMVNERLAILISQEKALEDSVAVMRYNLSLVEKDIDSLSSRSRIDKAAQLLGLGMNEVATKITERSK